MLQMLEKTGDRLLSAFVPTITATADPGCECSGNGHTTYQCGCSATAGSWRWIWLETMRCDGCRWYITKRCYQHHLSLGC